MRNIFFATAALAALCMTASAQVAVTGSGKPQQGCPSGICKPGTQPTFYDTDSKPEGRSPAVGLPAGKSPAGAKPEGEPRVNQQAMQQKVEQKMEQKVQQKMEQPTAQQKVQSAPPIGALPPPRSVAPPASMKNTSQVRNMLFDKEVEDSTEPGTIYQNTIEILPEATTKVDLSSIDINRIVCHADIKDVVYSKEKGLSVRIQGKNAFMKFVVAREEGKTRYTATPVDVYVVCDGEVYSMIAYPKRIPAQAVRLARGKRDAVKRNTEMFGGIPFEKKIMTVLKAVFTDTIPDSFSVAVVNRPFNVFQQIDLVLKRIIAVEGEGIKVKEYIAQAKTGVYLREKNFLRPDLTTNTVAVSLGALNLKKDETSRILIVEQGGS